VCAVYRVLYCVVYLYISEKRVLYCVVYLYISEKPPRGRAEDVRVKLEPLSLMALNSSTGRVWQQDACLPEGARAEFSIHPEEGNEGRTREVPQED
jgi:hypothetical protein